MKGAWVAIAVVVLIVLVGIGVGGNYASSKNAMVAKDQQVSAAFSQIDVDMQRRADLIPNLVESVKGYAKQEQAVITAIANARAGLLTAQTPDEKIAANDRLSVALLPLTRMQETYPQLKSNDQFMRLEDELAGTENRIAVSRKRYNDSVQDFNTFIQQFPQSFYASHAGFHPHNTYFAAQPGAAIAPKVDFSH